MLIKVTAKDIRQGECRSWVHCPIALAVKRNLLPNTRVTVGSGVLVTPGCVRELPRSALRFIKRFDAGKRVKPFAFKTDLPRDYLKGAVK